MYVYIEQKNGISSTFDILSYFEFDNVLALHLPSDEIIHIRLLDISSFEICK